MPVVRIDEDEWWPVYSIVDAYHKANGLREAELSESQIEFIEDAFDKFDEAQTILMMAYKRKGKGPT